MAGAPGTPKPLGVTSETALAGERCFPVPFGLGALIAPFRLAEAVGAF